ncbi:MAG: hypothetical protein WD595_03550 [Waddliaceae bacterium]
MNYFHYCTTQIEGQGRLQDLANLAMTPCRVLLGGRDYRIIEKDFTQVPHKTPSTTVRKVMHVAICTFSLITTLLIFPILIATICKLAAMDEKSWKLSQAASLMRKANLTTLPIKKHERLHALADILQWHTSRKNPKTLSPEILLRINRWDQLTVDDLNILNSKTYCRQLSEIRDVDSLVKIVSALIQIDEWKNPKSRGFHLLFTLYEAYPSLKELPAMCLSNLVETIQVWERERGYELSDEELLKLIHLYHNFHFDSPPESVIRTYHLVSALEWSSPFLTFITGDRGCVSAINARCHRGLLHAPKKMEIPKEAQAEIESINIEDLSEIARQLNLSESQKSELKEWIDEVNELQKGHDIDGCACRETKRYLQTIIYKFQDPKVSADKKLLFIQEILEKKGACAPSWPQITRTTMRNLYGVGDVREQLLIYIQDIKDGIFLSGQNDQWHILSYARRHFGRSLGLDVEAGESDGYSSCINEKTQSGILNDFNSKFNFIHLISALQTKIREDDSIESRSEIQKILSSYAYSHYLENRKSDSESKEVKEDFDEFCYVPETFFEKKDGNPILINTEGVLTLLIQTNILDIPRKRGNISHTASHFFSK